MDHNFAYFCEGLYFPREHFYNEVIAISITHKITLQFCNILKEGACNTFWPPMLPFAPPSSKIYEAVLDSARVIWFHLDF